MAVDIDTITKKILTGKETPAFGPPSNAPGFPKDIAAKRFKFDPAQAKALLAQAGFANGFTTNYFFPPDSPSIGNAADVAPAIAGYLADVGIKANLQSMPQAQFLNFARSKKEAGLFHLAGTTGDVNVTFFSQYRSDGVITLSHDPALNLDPLIDRQAGELDPAKRGPLIAEITTKFYENASWLFLYEGAKVHLGRKNIEWVRYLPTGTFPELWNIKVLKS
jgi:peptide/nickel transport system substrate-binding protein